MFLVGSVVVVVVGVVTEEGVGGVEDVERGGTSVDVRDVSVDGTEEEVTVTVVEEVIFSDEEENGVEAEGVELDSEGVAWAGFDSSHRPFLQQGRQQKEQQTRRDTQYYGYCYRTQDTCSVQVRNEKGRANSPQTAHISHRSIEACSVCSFGLDVDEYADYCSYRATVRSKFLQKLFSFILNPALKAEI